MDRRGGKRRQEENLTQKLVTFASLQTFVGLFNSVMSAFFLLLRDKPWSWEAVLYLTIPFMGFSAIYAVIAVAMKIKYRIAVPFVNQKVRLPAAVLFLVFIGLNLALRS